MAYKSEDYAARRLLSAMRKAGMTLPRNPQRAIAESQSMMDGISSGSLARSVARYKKGSLGMGLGFQRYGNVQKEAGGNLQMALPMKREPLGSLREKGIPFDIHDEDELMEIRRWTRIFKSTHYLIPLLISIYARFPIQGMSFQSKDPQIKAFYEELFFDRLNYETYMIDFGEEFFTVGEVNSLASFNETLGVWDNEEIINPDDLIVQKSPFSPEDRLKLRVPQTIRDIIENTDGQANPRDMQIIQEYYPEFLRAVRGVGYEEGIDVSSILLNRTVQKASPWDTRGTPQMLRCFRQLMSEESLNAAQDAISDRLYSPLILAKLGSPDLGDGEPWIPDPEELEEFRDDMQMAMASDFRFLSYHFGLDIQNVFGRESMPRLGEDYDRIERKILQVWGIGEELISGGNSGTYASSALNREFLTQMMSTYQKYVEMHIRHRCEVVAEAQGHFDYETSNGVKVPIYEEIYEVDEYGKGHIRKRPKLLLPDIRFSSINLRDEDTERQFLMMLKQSGVPISDEALMTNIPFEFKDELEQVEQERVQKILAEARSNVRAIKALEAENLPLSSDMQMIKEQMIIAQNDAVSGIITPPETVPPAAPDTPMMTPAPNVAPDEQNQMPQPGTTPQQFPETLPRNQIAQRPEISDEMRANSPRMSKKSDKYIVESEPIEGDEFSEESMPVKSWYSDDPWIIGMRKFLKEESVSYFVEDRPWQDYLPAGARRRLAEAQKELNGAVAALESGEHATD